MNNETEKFIYNGNTIERVYTSDDDYYYKDQSCDSDETLEVNEEDLISIN